MATKRYNPYKVGSKEVLKFRGITDESEAYNSDDAYASGMNNVESFKIRSLSQRTGQLSDSVYASSGVVHQGGSFVGTKGIAVGSEIWAKQKSSIFLSRPQRYPWRTISTPLSYTTPDFPKLTIRCRDITVPEGASRVDGVSNKIVSSANYLSCFQITCGSLWGVVGELEGYTQNEESENDVVGLLDSFDLCFTPNNSEDGGEDSPDLPIIPGFPWPELPDLPELPPLPDLPEFPELRFPEIPEYVIDDPEAGDGDVERPETCRRASGSFTPPSETAITIILEEGYTEHSVSLEMKSSLTSTYSWGYETFLTAEATDGAFSIEKSNQVSQTSRFSCGKSGTNILTITVPEGIWVGSHLQGQVRAGSVDDRWSIPLNIYIVKASQNYTVDGHSYGTKQEKIRSVGGSFPNVDEELPLFHAQPYVSSDVEFLFDPYAESKTEHECTTGALNVNYTARRIVIDRFAQSIQIPSVAGLDTHMSGAILYDVEQYITADGFEYDSKILGGTAQAYACAWWPEGDVVSRTYSAGRTGTLLRSTRHVEILDNFVAGEVYTVDFEIPADPPNLPAVGIDPIGGGTITARTTPTNLRFIAYGNAN